MNKTSFALTCYRQIIETPFEMSNSIGESVYIPKFTITILSSIIQETLEILKEGKALQFVEGSVVVVGDIHGNFQDLIRIMAKNGYPPAKTYVFLGDYVDRGDMSIEVIVFLFVLKTNFPNHVFLLRGNHEFAQINRSYGFYDSVMSEYNSEDIWNMFNQSFEYLPIAVVINNQIFCVHGGISQNTPSLASFSTLTLPIKNSKVVTDVTWSDPTNATSTFIDNQRGKGCQFGSFAANQFLTRSQLRMIIRSHECVSAYRWSFSDQVLTVFSSSQYASDNLAGYATVDEFSKVVAHELPPIKRKTIADMLFYPAHSECDKGTMPIASRLSSTHVGMSLSKLKCGNFPFSRKTSKTSLPVFSSSILSKKISIHSNSNNQSQPIHS